MNEVKKQIVNHLKVLDHEDPFHDRHYDMEIKDELYDTNYIMLAINELIKEKVIDPVEPQKIGNQNVWLIHRKKLTYYEVQNDSPKAPIIGIATSKDINSNQVREKAIEEAKKFGLNDQDFDIGFPQFFKTVNKARFDYYDVKIKA